MNLANDSWQLHVHFYITYFYIMLVYLKISISHYLFLIVLFKSIFYLKNYYIRFCCRSSFKVNSNFFLD